MTHYQKIVDELESDIDSSLKAGDSIPSFSEIMRRFGVSKITAQSAVKRLKENGSVSFHPGKGYFVSKIKTRVISIATYACYRPFNLDISYAAMYNAFAEECVRRRIALNVVYEDDAGFAALDDCVLIGMFDPKDVAPFAGRNAVLIDAKYPTVPTVAFDMLHACRLALAHAPDAKLFVLPPSSHDDDIERSLRVLGASDIRTVTCSRWYDEDEAQRIASSLKGEAVIAFNNIQANLLLRSMGDDARSHIIALKKSVNEIGPMVSGVRARLTDMAAIAVECITNPVMRTDMEIAVKGDWVEGNR